MLKKLVRISFLFIILRACEFIFATFALTFIEKFVDGNFSDITFGSVRAAMRIGIMYDLGFLYVPFSYIIFIIFLTVYGLGFIKKINLSYLNSVPYIIHSLPFMELFGLNPFVLSLWLVWISIFLFNFYIPKFLLKKGWIKVP